MSNKENTSESDEKELDTSEDDDLDEGSTVVEIKYEPEKLVYSEPFKLFSLDWFSISHFSFILF